MNLISSVEIRDKIFAAALKIIIMIIKKPAGD